MRDLTTQLRSYAELLDASALPVADLLESGEIAPDTVAPRRIRPTWRRPVAVAVGVAAVVVVVVGGLLLIARATTLRDRPVATTSTVSTMPATAGGITVTPVGDVPAITAKSLGGVFITPGGVVAAAGRLHAFVESYGADGTEATVHHAVSSDGVTWQVSAAPIFTSGDVPFGLGGLEVDSAVVAPDGTWVIYFSIITVKADVVANTPWVSVIGAATAPSPDGPWQVVAAPVLEPSGGDGWDGLRVSTPTVVAAGDELTMLYAGVDPSGIGRIGRARSGGGISWERSGDPVITPDAGWEDGETIRPDLIHTANGWIAAFSGSSRNWRGLAYSGDGVNWIKDPRNPLVSIADLDRPQLRASELVDFDGKLLLLVENGGARSGSELTVLRLSGEIPPDG